MAYYEGQHSNYNAANRFQNLDGVEWKIISHLINSETKHADNIWKILKYDSDVDALAGKTVSKKERLALVSKNNGEPTKMRVFMQPFVDDAWSEQCSSLYVYVSGINPTNLQVSTVDVTVECIVHSKISVINGDGDEITNPDANPNDSNEQGNIVVTSKNRATVLLKSLLAELNGLYIDGIGYLIFNSTMSKNCKAKLNLWNSRSFYGYSITFTTEMSGVSDNPEYSL